MNIDEEKAKQMPQSNDTDTRTRQPLRYPLQRCPTCGMLVTFVLDV